VSINDLPVLSALRTKMQWHQERQRVLSENVANADTPNFKPRDLVEPKLDFYRRGYRLDGGRWRCCAPAPRISGHRARSESFDQNKKVGFQTRPRRQRRQPWEEEMLKVSANQMDYAAATSLYSKRPASVEDGDRQKAEAEGLKIGLRQRTEGRTDDNGEERENHGQRHQ